METCVGKSLRSVFLHPSLLLSHRFTVWDRACARCLKRPLWESGSWSHINEESQGYRFFEWSLGLFPNSLLNLCQTAMQLKDDESPKNVSRFRMQYGKPAIGKIKLAEHVKRKWRFWRTSLDNVLTISKWKQFKEYLSASDYFLHIISLVIILAF